jgi:hypothetical protein
MDIHIKCRNGSYSRGSMLIHLDKFLDSCTLNKFKKLLNIIEQSDAPECADIIRQYLEQEIEQYEPLQKLDANKIVGYTEKVKFCNQQLENVLANRNRFRKSENGWKHYNTFVKQFRTELSELKSSLNQTKTSFNKRLQNHKRFLKCLEITSKGR